MVNHADGEARALGMDAGFSYGRDQTSAEDKKLNEKYRQDRASKGETFQQASLNQANASPLKFGLGTSDVHGADRYAVAKILGANLLSQHSESENRQSTTYATISSGTFNMASPAGKEPIGLLARKTPVHEQPLAKIDRDSLLKEVELARDTTRQFINTAIVPFTDEAYRTQLIAEHSMMSFVTDKEGKPVEDPEIFKKMREEAKNAKVDEAQYYRRTASQRPQCLSAL